MATITTTTNSSPFIYPATSLMDMDNRNRYLYVLVKASTANVYEVWRSINGGASWTSFASVTRASVAEVGPINVPTDGYLYWAYRTNESSQDRIYLRRLDLSTATWSAELLVASAGNGGSAGAVYQGMDLKSFSWGTTYQFVPIAVATHISGQAGVVLTAVRVTKSSGAWSVMSSLFSGTRWWTHSAADRHHAPSLDYEHAGDNENGTPNLWVAFGPTDVRLVKLAWGANGWTGPSYSTLLISGTTDDYVVGRWDGSRFVIPRRSADTMYLLERNKANTATTTRGPSPAHPAGTIRNYMANYNSISGDVRVYAVGTSSTVLYYCDYVRATATWTSWGTVTATAVLGTAGENFGVRRSTWGNAHHDVYTAHSGTPNTLAHTAQSLSYAPNAPMWDTSAIGYVSGAAADVAAALNLAWTFSDPDDTDTQSAWALSRQIGAGTIQYLRASDSTWQATEQKNTGTTPSRTLASGWGVTSDSPHTYKVKVWDAADLASSYSNGFVVIPSGKVNPTMTSPTTGAVINRDSVTVTWTVAEQSAFRVQLKILSEVVYDSGWITGTATSYTPDYPLGDGFSYTVVLQTKNAQGLASTAQQANITVDFVEPAHAVATVTPIPASGVIRVVADNPAPVGDQPAVSYQRLYRRPLVNPWLLVDGLEVNLANWGTPHAGTVTRSSTLAKFGTWSLKLTSDGTDSLGSHAESVQIPCSPGVKYYAEAWAAGPTNRETFVQFRFYDSGSVYLSSATVNGIKKTSRATNGWDPRWVVATAPATAATLTICLVIGLPASGDIAYFDDIRYRVNDPTVATLAADDLGEDFTVDDWKAVSGVAYEYRVETHSVIGTTVGGLYYS